MSVRHSQIDFQVVLAVNCDPDGILLELLQLRGVGRAIAGLPEKRKNLPADRVLIDWAIYHVIGSGRDKSQAKLAILVGDCGRNAKPTTRIGQRLPRKAM